MCFWPYAPAIPAGIMEEEAEPSFTAAAARLARDKTRASRIRPAHRGEPRWAR